jgi:lipopolysaccharide transport system ATP-binding protein
MPTVISVEHLSKSYRLGQIGTGTFSHDLNVWWARVRGKPNPMLRIGESDNGNRQGETIWALKDVSFTVEQGEVLGIIGRNGAGKSTLLKILSRVTAPTSGKIKVKGRVASLLEVGTGFHPDLTGRENIYLNGAILGMSRGGIARKFDEIVDFAGVEKFIDTPVKRYSSGMYVRLAFAVAAHLDPEILVVDEVLAVGDAEFQRKCLGKMSEVAKEGRTVLFVSHNMASIQHLCERGLWLNNGRILGNAGIAEVVGNYLSSILEDNSDRSKEPHVLYENDNPAGDFAILSVEILDGMDNAKERVYTWDKVKLKVRYSAKRAIRNGSLVIKISDRHGSTLALFSTQPDSKVPMNIQRGEGTGYCIIESLPFSAGKFFVGCGLAVPNQEWLCWNEHMAILSVAPRDVFDSGLAPDTSRSLLAIPHRWIVEQ